MILATMESSLEGAKVVDLKDSNKDLASLNAPVRNILIMPLRVPNKIPYT